MVFLVIKNNEKHMQEEKECHDCKKTLEHGDLYMPYQANGEEIVKCKSCHEKDPTCRNFQPTEVYTRVVGYIRPVQQWNKGKRQEYDDRKEYSIKK